MKDSQNPMETLTEIRSLMERSSRFISLSGLTGVFAGFFALIGAGIAWWYLEISLFTNRNYHFSIAHYSADVYTKAIIFFILDAGLVLTCSLGFGLYFSMRKARKKGIKFWDKTAFRLLENLSIPLITGGLFCLILLYHGLLGLIAPAMLIFYGLALINGSKYTLSDIRYLGFCEILLGLLAGAMAGYGLLFWAIGFGVLHILYGVLMYVKYELE